MHGLVDPTVLRSRAGIRAVSFSLGVLTTTAVAQTVIYARTLSVALLADLIHNFGDAAAAIPRKSGRAPESASQARRWWQTATTPASTVSSASG